MKFIIGYKQAMTQKYREDGTVVPVTAVKVEPNVITQVRNAEKDGYNAVQLGIGTRNKLGKAGAGHINKIIATGRKPFAVLKEVRVEDASGFEVGQMVTAATFANGDVVHVTGTSKGKGFQGVVKRHGFGGSPASHGHKDQLRMPGSIGGQEPQRVFKGTRMGGRMGNDQVTVKNLEVVTVDVENNVIYVKGALPGAKNSLVIVSGDGELKLDNNIFKPQSASKKDESKSEEPAKEEEVKEEKTEEAPKQEEAKEEPKVEQE